MVKIGYTSGVFDLFHVGHLNLLKNAKANCDFLIVAMCSDGLAKKLKHKTPVICLKDRLEIVSSLRCVDKVVIKYFDEEFLLAKSVKANIVFKGSDWKGSWKWEKLEKKFKKIGVEIKYFPYTKSISSSEIRSRLK